MPDETGTDKDNIHTRAHEGDPEGARPQTNAARLIRRPVNSYRLQLSPAFGLAAAAAVLAYLRRLGVTDCYTSPYFVAATGSLSGYDVCDHSAIQPELGGALGLETFARALAQEALGHIIDLVPNHMGTDPARNGWWRDVLQYGERSRFAGHFDIDWTPEKAELRGRLLLPILGKPYGAALEEGDIRLVARDGEPVIACSGRELPVDPATPLAGAVADATPPPELHALLERQVYRLAYWRTASDEINYRRFFDIEDLAGIRMERADVFEAAHVLFARLVRDGIVTSARVDHPDGLARPAEYLARLQALARGASGRDMHVVVEKILVGEERLPEDWAAHGTTGYDFLRDVNGLFVDRQGWVTLRKLYTRVTDTRTTFETEAYESRTLIMETTLASEVQMLAHALNRISERHPRSRDFTLNSLRRALVEFVACLPVYRTYVRPGAVDPHDAAHIRTAAALAQRRNEYVDPSVFHFIEAIAIDERAAVETGFPPADAADVDDHRRVDQRLQQFTGSVFAKGIEDTAFYRHYPLLSANEVGGDPRDAPRSPAKFHRRTRWRAEHAPLGLLATATHDAKLGEDARARLNALSEIPVEWAARVRKSRQAARKLRTASDDDWIPDAGDEYRFYQVLTATWSFGAGREAIEPDAGYAARVSAYMLKAARESKRHTSWIHQNAAYEDALIRFVRSTLEDAAGRGLRAEATPFVWRVARIGVVNSLSQLVLKIASPGVVDVYQGGEFWDLNLVDPDNRRPVDFAARAAGLDALEPLLARIAISDPAVASDVRALLDTWPDARVKLLVTAAGLRLRRTCPDLFLAGDYEPIATAGRSRADVVALLRRHGTRGALAAVPRLVGTTMNSDQWPLGAAGPWQDKVLLLPAALDGAVLTNAFTGERVTVERIDDAPQLRMDRLFASLPVGIWTWGV